MNVRLIFLGLDGFPTGPGTLTVPVQGAADAIDLFQLLTLGPVTLDDTSVQYAIAGAPQVRIKELTKEVTLILLVAEVFDGSDDDPCDQTWT